MPNLSELKFETKSCGLVVEVTCLYNQGPTHAYCGHAPDGFNRSLDLHYFKAKFWVCNTTSLSQNDFHNHSRLVEKSPWFSSLEMVFIPPRSRPPKQGLYGHQM